LTTLVYIIVLFYGTSNIDVSAPVFPLASVYYQVTGSNHATLGLLCVIFFPILFSCIGDYITAGRTLWTLARDDVTPFPRFLQKISSTYENPFNATLVCGVISTLLGLIYLGSSTAFNAFVGCFIILSTLSYLAAILPFVFTGRFSRRNGMIPGPFKMSNVMGYTVNILSAVYMIAFGVIYCFPYSATVTVENMNYSCLITGGLTLVVIMWWYVRRKDYQGPTTRFYSHATSGTGI
jgi:choline transport protein